VSTIIVRPLPSVVVTAQGSQLSSGQCTSITQTPSMPTMTAQLVAAPGSVLSGNISWQITIVYVGPDGVTYNNESFPATPRILPATQSWDITGEFTPSGSIRGGTATITYTYGNQPAQQFSFCINGQNPTITAIKARLGTNPWFIQHVAKDESDFR